MTPTPRAFFTVSTATEADLCALVWKQSTTFPFTRVAFRDPAVTLHQYRRHYQMKCLQHRLYAHFLKDAFQNTITPYHVSTIVAKNDLCKEYPINGARSNSDNPWGRVDHRL
ncbi:Os09g0530750 [Oryza sativa Japonica Group]|uniref:Os09g0530750 protein n=1 Tax=Oryza sativa subsp. japonica TaxID=39947 RepID=A0A0N7KR58_ORYSJ|nr:hypothetical protein EE612_049107 [Oryza sativa]BAT09098.1 Os09g0530750 [Oryza sativa Japonica Group]